MTPLLELQDLSKRFGGLAALSDCSFSVQPGSITGLIGPNGAGKSTVFNLITGVLKPDGGRIFFRGENLVGLAPDQIAGRGLGRTFQTPRIFPTLSVWENLMVAGPVTAGEGPLAALLGTGKARERARSDEAHELIAFLGLGSLTDAPASSLSGGQRKLLSLGRVLMMRPQLVLLDEPAAGVNATLARSLFERIATLRARGITFLIIEHNMDLIMANCDRLIVLHNGHPLAEGTPEEVRRNPLVLEAYLGGAVDAR